MLALRGGILEGAPLTGEQVDELATLPPVDELRGQLVGAIVAPLTQLLALVSAPLRDLHGLVDARIKQLEEQGEVVEPRGGGDDGASEPARKRRSGRRCGRGAAQPDAETGRARGRSTSPADEHDQAEQTEAEEE